MTTDTSFGFLSKVPDQCGYLVFADRAIVKSDGDLSNREATMVAVEKILGVLNPNVLPNTKFYQLTVSYPEYSYTIIESGRYTFVVKRRLHT